MSNILHFSTGKLQRSWKRLARWKKVMIIAVPMILLCLLFIGIWALLTIQKAKPIYAEGLAAKQNFETAQQNIQNQEFDKAIVELQEAHTHFQSAQTQLRPFKKYEFIPVVQAQMKAAENLLQAGVSLSAGLQTLAKVANNVNAVVKDQDASFNDVSAEQKRAVLQQLSESSADLQGVKSDIELAVISIENIPDEGLLKQVRNAVEPIKEQLPLLEGLITQAIPAAESLPVILGYPEQKTYLFLLQNNNELRPGGGFIGTYGILKLDAGEIKQFETENIYVLDIAGQGKVTEPAPGPITQHTSTKQWYMRDSNWSPDFPTNAQKAESKYYEEGGPETNLDGVIAITPTVIESLLKMTGSITVDGVEFTEQNLFEQLQLEVEFNYSKKGISDLDRKAIIGHLATELMNRIMSMPRSRFAELWDTFVTNVDQKQIQLYVDDPITQSLILAQNWGGEMKEYGNSDYLMVVDANLAALKTDRKMERSIAYNVLGDNGSYYGSAEVTYINHTEQAQKVGLYTRYRTYTRIYLPYGSELVEYSGYLTNDVKVKHGVPTAPEVTEESFTRPDGTVIQYTVVGGFTAIEPRETGKLYIKYKLPQSVAQQINNKTYTVYIQKQSGTHEHGLHFNFDIGQKINNAVASDLTSSIEGNKVSFDTDLQVDREFTIYLK